MSNPAVKRSKVYLYGFIIWTSWIIFYTIVLKIQTNNDWLNSVMSSAFTYYIYAILSIGIWFTCKRIPFDSMPIPVLILVHFLLSISYSALWLFLTYGLWYLAEGEQIFTYFDFRLVVGWQFLFGMITYLLIAGIFYTIIYYRHFREKELKEAELLGLTRDAEFKALKMQLNPHFLFNALNSINALVTQNPELSRKMVGRLSELLRISLDSRNEMCVPLKEELDFVHLYLELESIRFGDRMNFEETVDEELHDTDFPAMVLQPLIENAVKYGVAEKRGNGRIQLTIMREGERIACRVMNTVPKHSRSRKSKGSANGTGLQNIRRRLHLLYADRYEFSANYGESESFEVIMKIPINADGPDKSTDRR